MAYKPAFRPFDHEPFSPVASAIIIACVERLELKFGAHFTDVELTALCDRLGRSPEVIRTYIKHYRRQLNLNRKKSDTL